MRAPRLPFCVHTPTEVSLLKSMGMASRWAAGIFALCLAAAPCTASAASAKDSTARVVPLERGNAAKAKPARSTKTATAPRKRDHRAAAAGTALSAGALASPPTTSAKASAAPAESRLIEIYRLIGQARQREALAQAETLVREHPNFQLAQLVYGDLLTSQTRPVRMLGDVPPDTARVGASALAELREESQLRLKALREPPPPGMLPSQFLTLAPSSRHAIAIDVSRSRLYLFENSRAGLRLAGDFYVSIGKLGAEKQLEGDQRTPLGVYFITSNLDPKSLRDFYGVGALPINYPNALDQSRGKTGSGIWLHGTPPEQFSRAPRASDGCVVLSNPDLKKLLRTVQVRTTPVVIAQSLQWQTPHNVAAGSQRSHGFEAALAGWQQTKSSGDLARLLQFYAPEFSAKGQTLVQWTPALRQEIERMQGRPIALKDLSYLRWTDSADTMVVTFGEVIEGMRTGAVKRQYWVRQGVQWKIFFEGVI